MAALRAAARRPPRVRRRTVGLLAAVLGLAAAVVGPAAAAAAPSTGLWLGRKGDVQISFTVNRAAGKLYIANAVLACRGSGFADLPYGTRDQLGKLHRYRVRANGSVPTWPYDEVQKLVDGQYRSVRHGPPPRLRARTGTISARKVGPYRSTERRCPEADSHRVRVRRVAARPVRDGVYHAAGLWSPVDASRLGIAPDFTVTVSGGGVLATLGHGLDNFLLFSQRGCALTNWEEDAGLLTADGGFAISGTGTREFSVGDQPAGETYTIQGQFSSPTELAGSYSGSNLGCGILDPDGSALSEAYVTRPSRVFRDGAPVGRARTPPRPPSPPPPARRGRGLAPPLASRRPGCRTKVTTGSVEALSSCFRMRAGVAVAHDRVRLNGIDLVPAAPGAIRIDTRAARLSTDGPVWVVAGPLRLARLRPRWDLARSVLFTAETPERKEESEGATKEAVPKSRRLGGLLELTGSVELRWEPGKTSGKVTVGFPETVLTNAVTGEASFSARNDAGLVLDGAKATFPTVVWGRAELRDASFAYTRTDAGAHRWEGGLKLYFPGFQRFQGIELRGGFDDHGYRRLTGGVDGLNTALAYGVFLQRLNATIGFSPFALGGGAGFTYGPQFKLPGEDPIAAISLDAGLLYENANPDSFEFTGKGKVAGRVDVDGKVKVLSTGAIDADGNFSWDFKLLKLEAEGAGWLDRDLFDVQGTSRFTLGKLELGGDWVISSQGLAACHHGLGPDFGAGYAWGAGDLQVMNRGCGIGPWTVEKPAQASTAAARRAVRVRVPAGRRVATFSVVGRDAPPQVTLTGPRGARVVVPAAPDGATLTRDAATVKDPASRTTYIAVRAPAAGLWKLAATQASTPVRAFRSALALPAVRIRAHVSGRGRKRTLRYRTSHLRHGRIVFYEQGRRARRVLANTRVRRGRIRFISARGPAGRRTIRAVVVQAGIPQPARRVAAYRAPGVPRAPRPRRLRVHRTRTAAIVTWAGHRGARYLVAVRGADGRRERVSIPGAKPRVRIAALPRSVRLRVTVRRRDALGRLGAAARNTTPRHRR